MSVKTLNTITFTFVIDGKEYEKTFLIDKPVKKEDADAIGIVMQKWITNTLEALV